MTKNEKIIKKVKKFFNEVESQDFWQEALLQPKKIKKSLQQILIELIQEEVLFCKNVCKDQMHYESDAIKYRNRVRKANKLLSLMNSSM